MYLSKIYIKLILISCFTFLSSTLKEFKKLTLLNWRLTKVKNIVFRNAKNIKIFRTENGSL